MIRLFRLLALILIAAIASGLVYVRRSGLKATTEPSAIETRVARAVRRLAIPQAERERVNPVVAAPEVLAAGMARFAERCAPCHAGDGSGNTEVGRRLYPKAPDMRLPATQDLSDGELFYVIEHGIRFTGMPGWGTGTAEGQLTTWYLVHFIRHLPRLTAVENERARTLKPRSLDDLAAGY